MSVHVQGTALANPLTLTSEPASPVTGTAQTAGKTGVINLTPYANNSTVPLKITGITFTNTINCTVTTTNTFPVTVAAGTSVPLVADVTPTVAGAYSFDVAVTWTT